MIRMACSCRHKTQHVPSNFFSISLENRQTFYQNAGFWMIQIMHL
uniref:Uncharacterized protein n=1 Tax=Rhizophora mucronata TaxID=61149 RepID=A0A2P2KK84_RHIMU